MSTPATSTQFQALQAILRSAFQLDRGDLDFGLYRIMNLKAREIEQFLEADLLPQVREVLTGDAGTRAETLQKELAKARQQAITLGAKPDDMPKIKDLKKQLADARADATAETDVYGHLASFFARYYDEGDFMSLRRYSSGGQSTYLIPYDGEEVKLHWANSDQYYIKTTENYASYIFLVGADTTQRRVRFEIASADNEKDNIKEADNRQRRFVPAKGKNRVAHDDNVLTVRFEHRPLTDGEKKTWAGQNGTKQQQRINEAAREQILKVLKATPEWVQLLTAPSPTAANPERTVLDKHLATYTARNTFDYFIHKDLGGFLRRELDLYLKSEVLNMDDIAQGDAVRLNRALGRARAVRHIAHKLIDFLAQLENFQKQLWLKRKFVLDTQYCITLDRVPAALYPQIAGNKAQQEEWVTLFAIDQIKGYARSLKPAFLKNNPYLVLDTRHFDRSFTDKLLAALSDTGPLDEQWNGLLVHGENFQALNLLQTRYRGQVKCVHIDPPYNTQQSGFLYKNNYRHSSWMAMMEDRIHAALKLLSGNGCFLCHIDENEYERLHLLFDRFSLLNAGTVIWDKRNPMTGGGGIATQHEYVVWRSRTEDAVYRNGDNIQAMLRKADELAGEHGGVTDTVKRNTQLG